MQSYQADSAALPHRTGYPGTSYYLALAAFADDVVGTVAWLFAYVGILALFAILGVAALAQLPRLGDEPALGSAWATINGCPAQFTANRANSFSKSKSYSVARRSEGDSAAGAGPQRQACDPAVSPDWLAGAEKLQLRGSL